MFNTDQKRAFIAVLLSGIVLFGWQYYFAAKTPVVPTATTATTNPATGATTPAATDLKEAPKGENPAIGAATATPATIQPFTLKNGQFEFSLNNDLTILDMKNPNAVFDFKSLSGSAQPLKLQVVTDYGAMDLLFQMAQQGPNKIVGSNQNYGVNFEAYIKDNGRVHFNLTSVKPYKYRLMFDSKAFKNDAGQVRHFTVLTKDVKTIAVGDDKEVDGNVNWVGTDYNFHLFALVFGKETPARYKTTEAGQLFMEIPNATKDFSGDFVFTKKNYDELIALGDNLHLAVDFGFFAILAVPTLRALQFVYKFIPNYGIAIILVTIFIRLITFPLQYKSFKSMKKMQGIQPELAKIKEKYKDEPQKMQKETMDLFKKAGANPLSGCLPLLLQMPFFFAIYRVLFSSVELVGAPFYGWIHDLSLHDPYYVLPILMAVAMFAQQKMTPTTTMDPTQAKIMMFMPVIFAFIMKSLPAGLVLYIFVSTTVGIFQQMIVYKMAD
ncbi:MAG: membrane protein insertase YidC [Bdellovibrionales bacterium]|nr:membrane protein insertase YidC [Bdellovibrionales bacterium]